METRQFLAFSAFYTFFCAVIFLADRIGAYL